MNVGLCLQVAFFLYIIIFTVIEENYMFKFFTLKTFDPLHGVVQKATFREKIAWLIAGRPLRSKKVVDRFLDKKHKVEVKEHLTGCATLNSNNFSLPSS